MHFCIYAMKLYGFITSPTNTMMIVWCTAAPAYQEKHFMSAPCPIPATPSVAAQPVTPGLLPLITLAIGFVMAMLDVTAVNVALSDI